VRTVVRNVVCLLSECLFFQKDHILRISDVINLTSLIKCGPIYLVNALKVRLTYVRPAYVEATFSIVCHRRYRAIDRK
jgi:hypothetical protein